MGSDHRIYAHVDEIGSRLAPAIITDRGTRSFPWVSSPIRRKPSWLAIRFRLYFGGSGGIGIQRFGNQFFSAGLHVSVAVLASSTFNPLVGINVSSLRFGATGNEASLVSCGRDGEDVNKDKLPDLACHFDVQLSGLQPGAMQAYLRGLTVTGDPVLGVAPVTVK